MANTKTKKKTISIKKGTKKGGFEDKTRYFENSKNPIYKKYLVDIDIAKLEDKICRDPEEFINLYGRNVIWDKKIETSKSMFKSLETITPEKLKKCCCSIYKKENMIIAYSGNSNYNSKIKNIISNAKI